MRSKIGAGEGSEAMKEGKDKEGAPCFKRGSSEYIWARDFLYRSTPYSTFIMCFFMLRLCCQASPKHAMGASSGTKPLAQLLSVPSNARRGEGRRASRPSC